MQPEPRNIHGANFSLSVSIIFFPSNRLKEMGFSERDEILIKVIHEEKQYSLSQNSM